MADGKMIDQTPNYMWMADLIRLHDSKEREAEFLDVLKQGLGPPRNMGLVADWLNAHYPRKDPDDWGFFKIKDSPAYLRDWFGDERNIIR